MPGDAPLSEGVDFFSGSEGEGLSLTPSPKGKQESKNEELEGEEPGDLDVPEAGGDTKSDSDDDAEPDADSDNEAEESDEDEEAEESDDEKEARQAREEQQVSHDRKKSVVIKTARKEFKMPPNAKALVKVDGKMQEVPLSELTNSYSSNRGISKKLEEIKTKEQTLESERERVGQHFKTFAEKAKEPSQLMSALGDLLDENGIDPLPFASQLRRSIAHSVMKMIGASPQQQNFVEAQLNHYDIREESLYYKGKVEKSREAQKGVAHNQQVVSEVNRVMQKMGIPDVPSFKRSFDALRSLKSEGKLKADDTTPDDVGHFWLVSQTIEDFYPELSGDKDALVRLFKIAQGFDPTVAEIKKVIRGYLGSSDEQAPAGGKSKLTAKPKAVKPGGTKPNKLDDLFF